MSFGIFQDWKSNKGNTKGRFIMLLFRINRLRKLNKILNVILLPYGVIYKIVVEWILGVEMGGGVKIGYNLRLLHGQGLVINEKTVIGNNCTLRQNTTIGNNGKQDDCPIIFNNVDIGSNVCIIGGVVIGNNVRIGAGTIIVKNIPDNCSVVGNPSRIIKKM
ncbi:serine acetyltransferase [Runella rosea]|uniref:Serine acetyltransferase n=1 Tax=Runella rosea TaxID=2259595 RepID=A0A344TEF7_9BACT|nr:serine acetyltransferase [Runella rosea]AXE17028.1 serine acetyltransferase [Runella rosea]